MSVTTGGLIYFASLLSGCGDYEIAAIADSGAEKVVSCVTSFAGNSIQFFAELEAVVFTVSRFEIRVAGTSEPIAPATFAVPQVLAEWTIISESISPNNKFTVTYTLPLGGKTFEGVTNA